MRPLHLDFSTITTLGNRLPQFQFVVEELLQHGAGVTAQPAPIFGLTTIQAAAMGGNPLLLNRLIEECIGGAPGRECISDENNTHDEAAATRQMNELEIFRRYIVNEPPARVSGRTALQAASQAGHLEILETLLELGADVNVQPSGRLVMTALETASCGGKVEK